MKKYWQILKKYKISLLACPLLVLVSVMCETVQPMYMADIIDNGVMQRDLSVITAVGGKMILIAIVGLIFSIANVYVSSHASIGFGTDLRTGLFGKIQQLSFFDIDRFSTASLITRLTSDISRIQQVIMMSMRLMLRSPLMLVMAVFFVVRINLELAGVLLAAIPILGFSVFFILRKGFPFFLKVQQKVDQLNEVVRENLINIRVVKSFVREDFEAHKFKDKSESLRDTVIHASNIIVSIFPVMQLVMNLSIIAILWMGGHKVMTGELKVGELISFVNYLGQVLMSLMMLSMIIMSYARASASSKRILEVLDTQPSLTDTPEGMRSTREIEKGEIAFEKVSFRYGGGETDVLRNISFHIRPGETVAIAGATGSAKSSLVQLIPPSMMSAPEKYALTASLYKTITCANSMPASEWCCKRTNSLREPSPKTFAGENRMPRKKNSKWQPMPPKPMSSSARCLPDTAHCWDGVESTFPADRSNASASPGPCCVNPRY